MQGDLEATPRCANCGYDLRGLPLPRRCPECGHLAGWDAERREAEAWYASWGGLLFLFPAPLAMAHLHHPRSQGVALRRLFYGFALPWLVLGVFLASASSIVFVSTYERWWESLSSPGVRRDVDSTTSEYRPFGDPGEFGGFHEPRSTPTRIYRSGWVSTGVRLTAPRPDARLITLTFSVFLSSGLCLATAHLLALAAIGFGRRVDHSGLSSGAALSATACLIPVNILALVSLIVVLAGSQCVASQHAERVAITAFVIGLMLALAWGVALLIRVGAAVLARQSGLRFLFGLLLSAVWLFTAGAALFVLVGPLLGRPRY